ncbi:hypothetical protein HDU67_006419 [Dinochytrium kinnereticum]|nr:hypothetical protein HDU67_006419 [Dinochytrium kinnereticum]
MSIGSKPRPKGTSSHTIGFPVFSVAFAPKKARIAIAGGGGPNKSGVKNAVIMYDIDEETLAMTKLASHFFGQDDDGVSKLSDETYLSQEKSIVAAANSPDPKVDANCRGSLVFQNAVQTVDNQKDGYQRVACFSPDGSKLVTGSTEGKLVLWDWPNLKVALNPFDMGGDIYDAHFDSSSKMFVACSENRCGVITIDKGKTIWSVEKPLMKKTIPCEFRGSKFGHGSSEGCLFTLVNAKSRKKSFVCKWDAKAWVLARSTVIALKPATAFAISQKGDLLAVGLADTTHGFPITSLAFSPSGAIIASGSADGTCHIAKLPKSYSRNITAEVNDHREEVRTILTPSGSGLTTVAGIFTLAGVIWSASAEREVRHTYPNRWIPSMLWSKEFHDPEFRAQWEAQLKKEGKAPIEPIPESFRSWWPLYNSKKE